MQESGNPFGGENAPIPAPTGEVSKAGWTASAQGANDSGSGSTAVLPAQAQGLNWGAFLLAFFWSLSNKSYIGLLCLVPYVGWIMNFYLLFKGNEMAWQNRRFESVEDFKSTQKAWATWGVGIIAVSFVVGILLGLSGVLHHGG